jgi:glucose/arabinose dehydrogenase
VVFVPFTAGKPLGQPVLAATRFPYAEDQARGRRAGVMLDGPGVLWVADDFANTVRCFSAVVP